MKPPRILVIGKNGQVGWELMRALAPLGHLTGIDYPEIDLTRSDSIRRSVEDTSPDIIVNAAAYTAVDEAESEPDLCMEINGNAPGFLAAEAARRGALLIHYSTDYVFDGTLTSPYSEDDTPNPLGVYGQTKLAGDEAIRQSGCDHLIFRLCWVYGARGKNFMLTMMELARERESLRVVADQFGCPSWCRMIAETTAQAVCQTTRSADRSKFSGTYHMAGSGHTSWHGFTEAILDAMPAKQRKCKTVEAIPARDYPTPAKRPMYSVLNCTKLEDTFGLKLPHWQHSLGQVLEK